MTLPEIRRLQARLNRRRRITILFLSAVMLLCLLACAYSAMKLLPVYGAWRRANHFDEHPIGLLSGPFQIRIEIQYDREPPRDISLVNIDTGQSIYNLEKDTGRSGTVMITGDFDGSVQPGHYSLRLRPGDNHDLNCSIDVLPSQKYISLSAEPYRNKNNDLWLQIQAGYYGDMGEHGITLSVQLTGSQYAETVYEFQTGSPELTRSINVSELIHDLNLDTSRGNHIEIIARAQYAAPDDSGAAYADEKRTLDLDAWPEYDQNANFQFNESDTYAYLAGTGH